MPWNDQHRAILRATRAGQNVVVNADAGSGKSTIAMEIARRARGRDLMLGFNQDMKQESIRKAKQLGIYGPRQLDILTFHGWGLSTFPHRYEVKPWKVDEYVREQHARDTDLQRRLSFILKHIRGRGFLGLDERALDAELREPTVIRIADDNARYWRSNLRVLVRALRDLEAIRDVIDFDDMCRMPVLHGWIRGAAEGLDRLFTDEIQDLNSDQIAMLSLATRGIEVQQIATGDVKQSVYGFRGAFRSMERVAEIVGGTMLPLNTTWRCRERVVEFVNEQVRASQMRAAQSGGEVELVRVDADDRDSYAVDRMIADRVDMVISSRNSTLTSIWIRFFKRGLNANLKGSGVVAGLKVAVSAVPTYNWREFVRAMRLTAHAGRRSRYFDQHADMARAVVELIDELRISNKHELFRILDTMKLQDRGIKLETVHSAKGREAPRVAVISDWFESQDDPVDNLRYVAMTRARDFLLMIRPNR